MGNISKSTWLNLAAILTATTICGIVLIAASLAFRHFKDGKRVNGRPLGEWMADLHDGDEARKNEARAAITEGGAEAVTYFVKVLRARKGSTESRVLAAEALSYSGRKAFEAVPILAEVLTENNFELKITVLDTLNKIPSAPETIIAPMIRLLADPHPGIRWRAVRVLGRVPETAQKSIPALTKACEDSDATVREQASNALKKLGIIVPSTTAIPPPPG